MIQRKIKRFLTRLFNEHSPSAMFINEQKKAAAKAREEIHSNGKS